MWKSASPESVSSGTSTANAATCSSTTSPVSVEGTSSHKSSEEVLNELLTLPQALSTGSSRPKKKAVNDNLEITDDDVLQEIKDKEHAAAEAKKKNMRVIRVHA